MSRRPSSPRPRPVVLAVLVAVLLLGACTHERSVPDSYGDTTRNNFQEGCLEALTVEVESSNPDDDAQANGFLTEDLADTPPMAADRASDVCTCSYQGISNPDTGIPFEEFKTLNEELEDEPAPLPESVQAIVSGCLDEFAA